MQIAKIIRLNKIKPKKSLEFRYISWKIMRQGICSCIYFNLKVINLEKMRQSNNSFVSHGLIIIDLENISSERKPLLVSIRALIRSNRPGNSF